MRLIVGLGNPGKKYTQTRHNIGFMVIDGFAQQEDIRLRKNAVHEYAIGTVTQETVPMGLLAKPLSYMNNSGKIVSALVKKHTIAPENILIVCDDMDLSFGTIRYRTRGSDGGHRGLRSVIEHLGTDTVSRLRIGIGKPSDSEIVPDYVLSGFSREEEETVSRLIKLSIFTCKEWLFYGITKNVTYNLN